MTVEMMHLSKNKELEALVEEFQLLTEDIAEEMYEEVNKDAIIDDSVDDVWYGQNLIIFQTLFLSFCLKWLSDSIYRFCCLEFSFEDKREKEAYRSEKNNVS